MNQFPERTFVLTVRKRSIEPGQAEAAHRATAILIKRRRVQKRRLAIDAEVFGEERLGSEKASWANWDSRSVLEGLAADAAVIGKDEIEKRNGECPNGAGIDERLN
jgi:hypothetical protein